MPSPTRMKGRVGLDSGGRAQPGLPEAPCKGKKSFSGHWWVIPYQKSGLGWLEAKTNKGSWRQQLLPHLRARGRKQA